MIALIPLITAIVPSLIKIAERSFSGNAEMPKVGTLKHQFVLELALRGFDYMQQNFPDKIPSLITRDFFSDAVSVCIKHFVAQGLDKS